MSGLAANVIVAVVSPAVMDIIIGAAGAFVNAANAFDEATNKSADDNGICLSVANLLVKAEVLEAPLR